MTTETSPRNANARPAPQPRAVVCPYCGTISGAATRCERCGGRFDPLSRQATQNAMGPWFVKDDAVPTRPGCSYETIARMVGAKRLTRQSVVRGPTTRQFWMLATRVPGVSHLLGVCHACQAEVDPEQYACTRCGGVFEVDRDRQHLGVGPARLLPGQGSPERIAAVSQAAHAAVELPSWSFGSGGGEAAAGAASVDPPELPAPAERPDDGAERSRARRLERRVASQQRLIGVLGGACVVLAVLALAIAFVARFQGQRAEMRGDAANADDGIARIEAIRPRAESSTPAPATSRIGGEDDAPASPGVEAADAESWAGVRRRVHAQIGEGTDEALTAAVLELEALERRGELPAEGVELLERLRTEQEARRIRSIP